MLFGVMFKEGVFSMHKIKWKVEGVSEFGNSTRARRVLWAAIFIVAGVIVVKFGVRVAIYLF